MTVLETAAPLVGTLLRQWRQRRRLSQLDLAVATDISARHLSFIETGRSRPTSAMILRLSEQLDVPLRERNALLLAGGFAPAYAERELDRPELAAVLAAFRRVLAAHQPYPALLVNRWWELIESNDAIGVFTDGAAPDLLEPPVNVLRLCLHPDGMASRPQPGGVPREHPRAAAPAGGRHRRRTTRRAVPRAACVPGRCGAGQ